MAEFWWNGTNETMKIHWISWDKLCLPKGEGGLGFRNMYAFNLGLLEKHRWQLINEPNSLVVQTMKEKYYPDISLLRAEVKTKALIGWRSICTAWSVIDRGSHWKIGKGDAVDIWWDR